MAEPITVGELMLNDIVTEAGAPLLALEQHPQVFVEAGTADVLFQPGTRRCHAFIGLCFKLQVPEAIGQEMPKGIGNVCRLVDCDWRVYWSIRDR